MLKFKTPRIQDEWVVAHPILRALVLGLADWAERAIGKKTVTVTCLWRTPEENRAAGGNPKSWHIKNRAADIRIWGWSVSDCESAKDFWDHSYTAFDKRCQMVVERDHIHVEVEA